MKSGYKVIWSDEALENLRNIIYYLETAWTDRELQQFSRKLEARINLIQDRPLLFPLSLIRKNVHRWVLSKQTTIYYLVEKKQIVILSLFDNRQDPKKLHKKISRK